MDSLDTRLKNLLCGVFKIEDISLGDDIETIDLWDSMMHMEVMVAIEYFYKVRIEPGQIVALTGVKAIQEYLRSRGAL